MRPQPFTRRRAIGITAAAAGLSLLPLGRAARAKAAVVRWRGQAMGAVASLEIHSYDRAAAERLATRAVAEVRRLESIFSLYREDSALATLNRTGVLLAPPAELVAVLEGCRRVWALTGGAFDPTVQPLWTLHREHFSQPGHDPAGPPADALARALDKVGFARVAFGRDKVVLPRRGMALTLNGIAQGFATDRVVEILRAGGMAHSLVDFGESRAAGPRPDGAPWRVGIADPDAPGRAASVLDVVDRAVATSGAYGFRFDPEGRFHHLFDPRRGTSANLYKSVTVIAPTAAAADALSTGFSLLPQHEIEHALGRLGETRVLLTAASGDRAILGPPAA